VGPSEPFSDDVVRVQVAIRGAVQGVGFRPFVYRLAQELGLRGWVNNSAAGVFVEAEGAAGVVRGFVRRLESDKPEISIIQSLEATFLDPAGYPGFEIRESTGGEKRALVMPDLATCPACVAEIFDPGNRRYRYPFTNCTNCGPRFSIIAALPYDRAATTMHRFAMCEACAREYQDPSNRRFHAQPNACPACGPQLALWNGEGSEIARLHAALVATADAIRAGKVAAVKGLGGFHLMVDPRNECAVRDLRTRKQRQEKPFALMAPSFEQALMYCSASDVEQRLLRSPECPIVLLPRRPGAPGIAAAVAPGNPTLGVMLPGTPLHHLLLRELGFPVVATSGNLSEEPICTEEHEAVARLHGIADVFLVHDRPILRHVDDSVVREVFGRELVLRRARGFAPLPIQIHGELAPVLAVGGHQKNTIAAAVGAQVFISQHIGDLENEGSRQAFQSVIGAFQSLYAFTPNAIACDLHPDYLSTQYAEERGLPLVKVQHHHAHILSWMAENHLRPPVLGISTQENHLAAWTGLPGVRDPARTHRQGLADRCTTRGHLLFVRRHVAGAGQWRRSVLGQGQGRGRAHRLFAARCPKDRAPKSRSPGGVFRRGLRDHRASQCHGGLPDPCGKDPKLLRFGVARAGAARHRGYSQCARQSHPGLPGRRPRVHRHGIRGIPAAGKKNTVSLSW
jgi:hydrogenase maturation protein HypF